ncbi:isoprenoid synthase domain-containing protein [Infundibulicybe gibba]|nr:isoprenoid synthase domain-containing protein [Infundibulicybe gibba]
MSSPSRRARFEAAYSLVRGELIEHFAGEGMPQDAVDWYTKNLDYNVPGGKLNRGMSVVDTAAVLGWCVELLQSFFLVSDDIMDSSKTRRSQPCYYLLPTVGMIAINDSFMLEGAIYYLLKKHFRSESYYVDLIELFHDTTYKTEMGQLVDLITAPEDVVDLNKFSLKKHAFIVIYKTAYYSFYLPVALAMHVCGIPESYPTSSGGALQPYAVAHSILLPLGEYFQIQDDYLDFSGTPEQIGKIGTDIVDNKCSWCINTALARCSLAQRAVLDASYGRKDPAAEKEVKRVFEEVGLRRVYAEYEEKVVGELKDRISKIEEREGGLKREVFESFLGKIYKRSK